MSQTHIAFIGLGNMGRPMAENLIKAGLSLTGFDLSQTQLDALVAAGGKKAATIADAVKNADVVISMLPSSPHVEDVYLGKGALLANTKKGALLLDCSTIAPQSAQKVASRAIELGFEMCDAPVSGGTAGAAAATLTFIVGGKKASFDKAQTILSKMGKNIFHAGDVGMGQVAKICNNMLLAIHMIGTSEALALGKASGMDPKVLSDIMKVSSGANWSLEKYNPWPGVMESVPSSREYSGGFGVDLMSKDLGLATEAALAAKSPTPLGSLARDLYRMHSKAGNGTLDFSSILKMFKS